MLQKMRERTQGIIAGVIVGLICLTFALWGIQNYLHSGGEKSAAAKIDGEKITQEQVTRAYDRMRQQMVAQFGSGFYADQKSQQVLKDQALDFLIRNSVMSTAVTKLGFYVGARELQAVLMQMPIFQVNGQFSPERFQSALSNLMYSESDFLNELRRSLLSSQLSLGLEESAFVLPNEVDQALALLEQKRDFGYFLIKIEPFLKGIKITDQAINDYYKQHQDDFMTDENVSIEYVELDAEKLATGLAKASDADLEQFYKENIDSYTVPKKWHLERILMPFSSKDPAESEVSAARSKLDAIYQEAKKPGVDFATLSPEQNKNIIVTNKQLDAEALEKINQLLPGEVSEPFRTYDGFNLVKLDKVEPAKVTSFSDAKDDLRKAYVRQKQQQLFTEQNDKLAELTYTNSASLAPAAQTLGLTVEQSDLFTKTGAPQGIAQNPKIVKSAFSDTVLHQGFNSMPLEIDAGKVVVLRIKKHNPSVLKSLADVQPQIVIKLKMVAAAQQAGQLAEEISRAYQNGVASRALSQKYNLVPQQMSVTGHDPSVSASDAGVNKNSPKPSASAIVDAAFALPNPKESRQPVVTTIKLADGSQAVIFVNAVTLADPTKIAPDKRLAVTKRLRTETGGYDLNLLMNKFVKNAKITKNPAS